YCPRHLKMSSEENEVRLTLLENSNSDGNNNLHPQSSQDALEVEDTFSDETTSHHSDDPSTELLSSEPLHLERPKVVIVPTNGSSVKNSPSTTQRHGIELVWRNLSYQIKKKSWLPFKKANSRALIHGLNGGIRSGQL